MQPPTPIDKYKIHDGYIQTITGRQLGPMEDCPDFNINDIAWAASMCVRFNGHVQSFYSLAEHGVLVSELMAMLYPNSKSFAYEGLMHDAIESYLSDVPSPFKAFLPDYVEFDTMLDTKLRKHFGVRRKTRECKRADWIALFIEAHSLLPNGGAHFADPLNLRSYALSLVNQFPLTCSPPPDIDGYMYKLFLARYEDLRR